MSSASIVIRPHHQPRYRYGAKKLSLCRKKENLKHFCLEPLPPLTFELLSHLLKDPLQVLLMIFWQVLRVWLCLQQLRLLYLQVVSVILLDFLARKLSSSRENYLTSEQRASSNSPTLTTSSSSEGLTSVGGFSSASGVCELLFPQRTLRFSVFGVYSGKLKIDTL